MEIIAHLIFIVANICFLIRQMVGISIFSDLFLFYVVSIAFVVMCMSGKTINDTKIYIVIIILDLLCMISNF